VLPSDSALPRSLLYFALPCCSSIFVANTHFKAISGLAVSFFPSFLFPCFLVCVLPVLFQDSAQCKLRSIALSSTLFLLLLLLLILLLLFFFFFFFFFVFLRSSASCPCSSISDSSVLLADGAHFQTQRMKTGPHQVSYSATHP